MLKKEWTIEITDHAPEEDYQILHEGICKEAELKKAMGPITPFSIFIKDEEGDVLGGVTGSTYYGCLYVDMLWVNSDSRQHGLGSRLMCEAERIGLSRKCTFAAVNTMDWEALLFYQKLGYNIEFIREGFQQNSKMYFLRKDLSV